MDRTERLYRIDRLLNDRPVVPLNTFLDELEVSLATFKRDLEYLRDRLNTPIVWDRELGGYRLGKQSVGDKYELPGLWFKASEIHALLTMRELLASLSPGLLTPHIEPLLTRLRMLLDREDIPVDAVEKRVHIHRMAARAFEPECFAPIATAVLQRRRIVIDHHNRGRNETIRREISPQRLTHYRENWYVDAWCHLRNELRSFGLDAISGVWLGTEAAMEVPEDELKAVLDAGYGIFSGMTLEWAELVFSPARARWVSKETWHPEQQGWFDDEGQYHLRVPFSNSTELAMDVLRHVPDVQVKSPESLKALIRHQLEAALKNL
ncbi:MAG: WYL domain-containing protein [Candidatus Dechloromonas phosphoritropha]|mgnify:FL=1|jgi:predicted DNA-binding transcriptional regulator YafY